MSEMKNFLVTIMKWPISGQRYKHLTRFSRFVLSKPETSALQKIKPIGYFSLGQRRFVDIHLFLVI